MPDLADAAYLTELLEPISVYVDNVKEEDYGFSYLFDGYMEVHVVRKAGWFYDVVDASPDDFAQFRRFPSLEDLVSNLVREIRQ